MLNEKWVKRFINLAVEASDWSHDPSTKVGAVITDKNKNIKALGYNGFPRKIADTPERLNDRKLKYPMTVHAEANVIAACAREGIKTQDAILICTHYPCATCAGIIIQAGIATVIVKKPSENFLERWGELNQIGLDMLTEAEVNIIVV